MSLVSRTVTGTAALALAATTLTGAGVATAPSAAADICLPLPLPLPCLPDLPVPIPGTQGPVATSPVAIQGDPTEAKVGSTLTATPPTWDPATTVTAYAWLRDGTPIEGATAATYDVTPADLDRQISVRARGSADMVTSTDSVSAAVPGVLGDPPTATTRPAVSGTPALGGTLSVDPGVWSGEPTPTFSYQWYRSNGRGASLIAGATETDYEPTTADLGRRLAVVVTAVRPAYEDGTAVSNVVTVPKIVTGTRLALPRKSVPAGVRAPVRVTLAAVSGAAPTGTVRVLEGRTRVATYTVRGGDGRLVARLPRLRAGRHVLRAVYVGDATRAGSRSTPVTLRVVRR